MNNVQSLRHTVWECKYHVIWIPKYRRKALYRELRRHLGEVIRDLARQEGEQSGGGSSEGGSRAYADFNSSQVCGFPSGWIHQGEARNSHSPE